PGAAARRPAVPPAPAVSGGAEIFDRNEALRRVGGDEDLLRSLAELFLGTCPAALAALGEAVAQRDPGKVRRPAHALKGSVSHFGAGPAFEAAGRLETMGRQENLAGADAAWAALVAEVERLEPALASLAAPASSCPS